MRPQGTTRDDETRRHDQLIRLLARRPPIRRVQRALDALVDLWRAPDHLYFCLGGAVHWRIRPAAQDVAIVAAHFLDARPDVRRAVLVALRHVDAHADEARPAVRGGLGDADPVLRIHAARAARPVDDADALTEALVRCLDDEVWTVRWYAARALSRGRHRARAHAALLASRPVGDEVVVSPWVECLRAFEGTDR